MRILKANGLILDIDDETAIGIDYQAYDFKKPGDIKVNVSNTFTIPATAKNLQIFGFAGRAYSQSNATFTRITIDYYIRNEQYITKGVARIERIEKGRIHLFVAERPEFIDEMKNTPLNDFLQNWFENSFVNEEFDTVQDFYEAYSLGHDGVLLPFVTGGLSKFTDSAGVPGDRIGYYNENNELSSWLAMKIYDPTGAGTILRMGGQFSVSLEYLFKWMTSYYSINLNESNGKDYNLFNDPVFKDLFIPVRNLLPLAGGVKPQFDFIKDFSNSYKLSPHDSIIPYDGLTVYDLFINTLKLLGYAIEPLQDGSYEVVRLDLINLIRPKSGELLPGYMADNFKEEKFIPNLEGYGVNNYIKMKPFSEGGEFLGAKKSISANKNLNENKDLFKVNAYIPPFLFFKNDYIPDLSSAESYKNIVFLKKTIGLLKQTQIYTQLDVKSDGSFSYIYVPLTIGLMVPEVYTVASEYKFLDEILNTPETRTVKRWVNSSMMKGFRKLAPYYVREFGAWYFVNKISNFNPEKSKEPVKFELVRLPWVRMPGLPEQEIESTDEWILADGTWNDTGIWIDTEVWNDTDPN